MGNQTALSRSSPAQRDQGREAVRRQAEVLERLWGVGVCADCGETIITGEEVFHVQQDGRSEPVCSACATAPSPGRLAASPRALPGHSVVTAEQAEDAA